MVTFFATFPSVRLANLYTLDIRVIHALLGQMFTLKWRSSTRMDFMRLTSSSAPVHFHLCHDGFSFFGRAYSQLRWINREHARHSIFFIIPTFLCCSLISRHFMSTTHSSDWPTTLVPSRSRYYPIIIPSTSILKLNHSHGTNRFWL